MTPQEALRARVFDAVAVYVGASRADTVTTDVLAALATPVPGGPDLRTALVEIEAAQERHRQGKLGPTAYSYTLGVATRAIRTALAATERPLDVARVYAAVRPEFREAGAGSEHNPDAMARDAAERIHARLTEAQP